MAHARALQQLRDVLRFMAEAASKGAENALIIDGKALIYALAADVRGLFLEVSPMMASPGQSCLRSLACSAPMKQAVQE